MLVSRMTGLGLGDLASELKARSLKNKSTAKSPTPVPLSKSIPVQQALNSLIKISTYNRDLAAGNINPNFQKPPSQQSEADARAAFLRTSNKMLGTKYALPADTAHAPVPALAKPIVSGLRKLFGGGPSTPSIFSPAPAPAATSAPTPAPTISPDVQKAAADVVAQQAALTAAPAPTTPGSGGGGGGGGTDDSGTTDMTEAPATGWAALGTGTKVAIFAGGLVVVGGVFYVMGRRR
jgi:hypothetical protein